MSDYLPEEVLIEILSRFPVKSLLRFICVSKPWRSLITSPSFINTHLNKSTNNTLTHLLLLRYTCLNPNQEHYLLRFDNKTFNRYAQFTSPFKTHFYFRVVGTCNGLVCLSDDLFGDKHNIILWNPMIRRYVALPKPSLSLDSYIPYMSVLGFGFDLRTNDYKVVRISHFERRKNAIPLPKVEVYSLKTGSWKALTCGVPSYNMVEYFWEHVFLSGFAHWIAYKRVGDGKFHNVILSFGFGDELFHEIELPETVAPTFPLQLGVHLVGTMIASGELLMGTRGGDMVSYQPESKRIEKHGLRGVKGSFYASPYVGSLVLLDGSNGDLQGKVNTDPVLPKVTNEEEADESTLEIALKRNFLFAASYITGSLLEFVLWN
ncbi:hypothetical protein TEA_007394 [Camellia sinensis var. sinensis]|uniref:F-box domain-containing protein n=1 Tax=Camellia sinensis var. sinensis TaxID=542762 RepID=A0A4S4ED83_CAMSN|nr:hypothetical protein TEA_007394 [Camellia sinensis var. sinensis]